MLCELRKYTIAPGRMAEWIELMTVEIMPFQRKMGMDIRGSYTALDRKDLYIWIRCFKDEAEKQTLYDRVYGSDYWISVIRPQIDGLLIREKTEVIRMVPTEQSRSGE